MNYERIEVEPIAGALGAEVRGLDLSQPLDEIVKKELQDAWMENLVLFFRDQDISLKQHTDFARNFGELHVHPVLRNRGEDGFPEVVVLESNEKLPFVAGGWHSDVTFEREPPLGSVLRSRIAPDHGGDTLWANTYAAYEALSDTMQRLLSELRAEHDGGVFRHIATDEKQTEELAKNEKTLHPVVRTHPVTGRKALYVNNAFTRGIHGMKAGESQALLRFLYEHLSSVDFTCRFRWRKDSIAMWDNRCTQHKVVSDNLAAHRWMERVTICGDRPV